MGFVSVLLMAVALSMDAFAVAVCKGLAMKKITVAKAAIVGAWFGIFQALMPLIGYFLGSSFAKFIEPVDHWIAFALLALIGANMLREALAKKNECECCDGETHDDSLAFGKMLVMAIATSIDALAVGISFALQSFEGGMNIFFAVLMIGVTTFGLSMGGVKIGNLFGAKYEKKAEITGGIILILLGIKILLEDLGVIDLPI